VRECIGYSKNNYIQREEQKRMGISMNMLVIELKPAGESGAKLLVSCVTLGCH
jgi:hypothetical protein